MDCRDCTRTKLLRDAIARAGDGLPSIEPGMPVPAGTGLTRRSFVTRAAGLAIAPKPPRFEASRRDCCAASPAWRSPASRDRACSAPICAAASSIGCSSGCGSPLGEKP